MGYKVQFEDGQTVEFDSAPSQADIDEAHNHVSGKAQAGGIGEKILGGAEGALSAASGLAAAIPTGIRTLGELAATGSLDEALKRSESTTDAATYQPRTETGKAVAGGINQTLQDYSEDVSNKFGADQAFLNKQKMNKGTLTAADLAAENTEQTMGSVLSNLYVPGIPFKPGMGKFKEAAKTKDVPVNSKEAALDAMEKREQAPTDTAAPVPEGERAFTEMQQQLQAGDKSPVNFPPAVDPMEHLASGLEDAGQRERAQQAQTGIDTRQADMEQQVKQQGTLDFNAAERARQEAAPTGYKEWQDNQAASEHPFVKAADDRVAKQAEVVRKLTQQVEDGTMSPAQLARAATDLDNFKTAAERTRDNVLKGASDKTQPVPFDFKRQGGAINPNVFKEGFEKLKQLADGTVLRAFRDPTGSLMIQVQKDGKVVGSSQFDTTGMPKDYKPDWTSVPPHGLVFDPKNQNLTSVQTGLVPLERGKGYAKEMYKFAAELGNDVVPSGVQTAAGKKMWEGFRKSGMVQDGKIPAQTSKTIKSPGNKQRGGVMADFGKAKDAKDRAFEREQSKSGDVTDVWKDLYPGQWKVGDVASYNGKRAEIVEHSGGGNVVVRESITGRMHPVQEAELRPYGIKSPGNKQTGGINVKDIKEASEKAMSGINDAIKHVTNLAYDPHQKFTDYMEKNIPGFSTVLKDKFAVPDSPETAVTNILKGKDTPPIWKWGQSGPDLTAAKFGENPLLIHTSRTLNYAYKSAELQIRTLVKPLQKYLSTLSTKEFTELNSLLHKEMFAEKRFSLDQLEKAGYSEKQIQGYKMQRAAMDKLLELENEGRKLSDKKPVTEADAYYASRWTGDYHVPILDKEGKLAWYIRTGTKEEAYAAIDHLRQTMGDKLKISDKTVPEYRANRLSPTTPRDVIGAYHDLLGFFSDTPEISSQIKMALEDYLQRRAYTVAGQNKHFLAKGNVRGAIGDQPWRSAKDNAYAGAKSQMDYMTNGIRWANTQLAINNLKQVLSDPKVVEHMPNALAYAKSVMAKAVGVDTNLFSAFEKAIAKIVPTSVNPVKLATGEGFGVSKTSLYRAMADMKTLTYFQMIGFSPAYMIATGVQFVMGVPMWHRIMTTEGFTHNLAKTSLLAMTDMLAGITNHGAHSLGVDHVVPMTELGKAGLKYAEDASIISKNLFDESSGLNEHAAVANVHAASTWTVGFPEKVARLGAFMSFVHHLDASGKFTNQLEMFRKAEELTDRAMTSFKPHDRPQAVGNLGLAGEATYMFKSYLFNSFNGLSAASRMALKGRGTPLATMVGMITLMGGLYNAPLIPEVDAIWDGVKNAIAAWAPQHYSKLSKVDNGLGIRGNLISLAPETSGLRDLLGYGVPSTATGIQLATRLNMSTGIDPSHPMNNLAPIAQEMKEQGALAQALLHPMTKDAWAQAAYINAPPLVKGNMEARMDAFKVGNSPGNQGYLKPNDLLNPTMQPHRRTEFDETMRKAGMTSLAEARDKDTQYIASKEQARIKTALGGLSERLMSGIKNQDADKIGNSAIEYLKLNPDTQALDSAIAKGIMQMNATPQEQRAMYLKTIQQINQYNRVQRMQR